MIRTYILLVLSSVVRMTAEDRIEAELFASLNEHGKILKAIEDASIKRSYGDIYAYLSEEHYAGVILKQDFIKKLADIHLEIIEQKYGAIVRSENMAYTPVRCVVRTKRGESHFHTVVFFRKEKGEWKLVNFPYAEPTLPNWLIVWNWLPEKSEPTRQP